MTERLGHHPQNIGVGHTIFLLFHPWNSNLKIEQLHGPANSSIELVSLPSTQQQSANPLGWMSVLLSRQPMIFSKTETPKKKISYSTKTQIPKKFRINIITIISKPSIKSSVNGFRQISYEQEKKFLMSPLNSNNLKIFHFTTSQNNVTITVQKCSVFFSFFNLCIVCFTKNVCSFFLSFFPYAVFNNVQVSLFFLFHFHCPIAFCFLSWFSFLFFFFIINCSFNVPCFSNLISTSLSLP